MLGTRKDFVSIGKVSEALFRGKPIERPQIELNASNSLTFRENIDDNNLYRNRSTNVRDMIFLQMVSAKTEGKKKGMEEKAAERNGKEKKETKKEKMIV